MLKQLLNSMLAEASLKSNTPVKRKLKGNLHIGIAFVASRTPGIDQEVHLALSRDKVYPSNEEWKTVLANFPYQVKFVEPIKFVDHDRRFAMRAKLPSRRDEPKQLEFPT